MMKNRLWKQRSADNKNSRQDSQESTVSTSSSIREFELFQQFCSNTSPTDWEVPAEASEPWPDSHATDDVTFASCSTLPSRSITGARSPPRAHLTSPAPSTASSSRYPFGARTSHHSESTHTAALTAVAVMGIEKKNAEMVECRQRRLLWSKHRSHTNEELGRTNKEQTSQRDLVSEGQLDSADELRQSVDALESSATTTLTSGSRGALLCHVRLLNGEQFTTRVEKKAVGQVLFDSVCKYLNIIERDYFACSYRDVGSIRMWLRNDKRIMDQLTDDTALLFQFEVKFYPPDIATLQEDITRYQFCLQIQNDIGSGCLPCSFLTYALLGSYLAQSVLGDYDTVELGSGFDYLRRMTFAPNQTDELLEKVAELHCNHRGLVPADAETEYLINASRLALYGVDVHHVLDYIGDSASVGVCSSGLMIYRDRLRIRRLPWVSIIQVSYKRCNFCVSVRPAEHSELSASGSGSDASYVIKFKMASKLLAKRLWRSTVEHHMFFRLKESVAVNNGILSRFLGSQFRFSGRTQQQVKRDAMVVSRRPQLAMSHQHGTTALHHAAVDGIVARSLSCDVDSDTNRCSSDQPTFCSEPCTFSADCQQTIDLYSTRSSQPVAIDNQSCLPPLATVTIPATTTVVAEILHVDTSPVAMTTTRHCAARFSPVPSATSSGTAVSMSSRQATPSRCSSDLTSSTVRTLNRLITVKTANGNSSLISDRPNDAITDFGMLISARSHTSRTHTVETTTYQTERDGVMVEKKLLINTEGAADPDKMLAAAIESVTAMGDELTVEKVEIHTVAELELD